MYSCVNAMIFTELSHRLKSIKHVSNKATITVLYTYVHIPIYDIGMVLQNILLNKTFAVYSNCAS